MCEVCNGYYDDSELIDLIQDNDVSPDILLCDDGWSELSKIWGKYGWAKKLISAEEWRAVCNMRGHVKYGN